MLLSTTLFKIYIYINKVLRKWKIFAMEQLYKWMSLQFTDKISIKILIRKVKGEYANWELTLNLNKTLETRKHK